MSHPTITRALRDRRAERRNTDCSIHLLAGIVAGAIMGMGVAGYALTGEKSMTQVKYDYAACRVIIDKDDLDTTNVGEWKSMTKTPEGRWCIV